WPGGVVGRYGWHDPDRGGVGNLDPGKRAGAIGRAVGRRQDERQAKRIGGGLQRVAVAESGQGIVARALREADAQLRPDAGRFTRDQREPGWSHGQSPVAGASGAVSAASAVALPVRKSTKASPRISRRNWFHSSSSLRRPIVSRACARWFSLPTSASRVPVRCTMCQPAWVRKGVDTALSASADTWAPKSG